MSENTSAVPTILENPEQSENDFIQPSDKNDAEEMLHSGDVAGDLEQSRQPEYGSSQTGGEADEEISTREIVSTAYDAVYHTIEELFHKYPGSIPVQYITYAVSALGDAIEGVEIRKVGKTTKEINGNDGVVVTTAVFAGNPGENNMSIKRYPNGSLDAEINLHDRDNMAVSLRVSHRPKRLLDGHLMNDGEMAFLYEISDGTSVELHINPPDSDSGGEINAYFSDLSSNPRNMSQAFIFDGVFWDGRHTTLYYEMQSDKFLEILEKLRVYGS